MIPAGQANASGDKALVQSIESSVYHVKQELNDQVYNQRVVGREGAGRLPKVQGPQIKIEPPVKEATRMK